MFDAPAAAERIQGCMLESDPISEQGRMPHILQLGGHLHKVLASLAQLPQLANFSPGIGTVGSQPSSVFFFDLAMTANRYGSTSIVAKGAARETDGFLPVKRHDSPRPGCATYALGRHRTQDLLI